MINYNYGSFGILDVGEIEDVPLALLDGGIEHRTGELYDFDNNKRYGYDGYLFQYTFRGYGCFEKDGKQYEVRDGMGFLASFPENSRYYLPQDSEWEFIYLHFRGYGAEPFIKKINQIWGSPFRLKPDCVPVLMATELQQRLAEGGRLQKYEGGEFMYGFLCALLRELESPSDKAGSLAERGEEIMSTGYKTLEGVEEVAERLEVSLPHFSRTFKKEKGISPVVRLTQIRIERAMKDLLSTDEGVSTIAEKNGFTSGNYFCKVFHKTVGMTPGEYRKRGVR